jgi:hypothetical protein
MEAARRNGRTGGKIMSSTSRAIDDRLILRLASQVERLLDRVAELENRERIHAQTIARHAEALDAIGKALSEDAEEIEERTTIQ